MVGYDIDDRWLGLGEGPVLSLLDDEQLDRFPETNDDRYLAGLAKPALLRALETYRSRGLEAFREAVSVLPRQEHVVDRLPERVAKIEAYPSLLGEYRHSCFRYSSPWEATLFVRLTPEDTSSAPVSSSSAPKGGPKAS